MSDLQVTNTFTSGIIDATKFNTNYSDIVTYINNRNSGSATWDGMSVSHATNVPLTANNSTGTQDIFQAQDNGSVVYRVSNNGFVSASTNPYCIAYADGGYSIKGTTSFTKINFTAATQSGSDFSVSTDRFTCSSIGKYLVNVKVMHLTDSTTNAGDGLRIDLNGSVFSTQKITYTKQTTTGLYTYYYTDIFSLSVNDYLEFNTRDTYTSPTYVIVYGPTNAGPASSTSVEIIKLS